MFQTLRVLLPPTVSPATSMQMTPRSTATADLRAFRVLSVEYRPASKRSSRGRHLIVYGSTLTGATTIPSQTLRSLGVYLDTSLTMGPHVGGVAAGCYAKLRVFKKAKPFVPHQNFMSLIVQLNLSKLDYSNSILVNASCRNLNTL